MTGRHSFRTWLKWSAVNPSDPLLIDDGQMTLASMLKDEGYNTAVVGKWHLGWGRQPFVLSPGGRRRRSPGPNWNGELKPGPLECGFDYSYVFPVANSVPPYVIVEGRHVVGLRRESPIGKVEPGNGGKMEGGEGARWEHEKLAAMLTNVAVSQLKGLAEGGKPFFLYYAPHQPHVPHRPGPRFKGKSGAGAYGDVILELDWSVGEILQTLERLGLTGNTLVIFSSDNGASSVAVNRSRLRGWGHAPNGILRGYKGRITEGGHRVPFMARWPGRIKAGTRSDELISLTDMMATFAAILGKELPPGAGPDSHNGLPELLGEPSRNPDRPVVLAAGTGALCLRLGKWKYFDGQTMDGVNPFFVTRREIDPALPPGQLYSLAEDIREANNLHDQHPELVGRMRRTLAEIMNAEQ